MLLPRTAVALCVFALSACGGEAAPPTPAKAESDPASSTQTEPEPKQQGCLDVSSALVKGIASGQEDGAGIKPRFATAVKSADFSKVYFVAVTFSATGVEDQTGVWATSSLKPGGGSILSVDGIAQEFTVWPNADATAGIASSDPSVDAAKECL